MKTCKLFLLALFIQSTGVLYAQTEAEVKLEDMKYYLSAIKDYTQSMRSSTDSVKILRLLDQMDVLSAALGDELGKIVLPNSQPEVISGDSIPGADKGMSDIPDANPSLDDDGASPEEQVPNGKFSVSKYMPFRHKFNTSLKIQFGINSWIQNKSVEFDLHNPEINSSGSWYWDISVIRKARLGGKDSKVALNYGLSCLINGFKIENDLRFSTTSAGTPQFVPIPDAKENPKLSVSYVNIPLSLSFALSRKVKFDIGGYAGYRIASSQRILLKSSKETINEHRFARYGLNNWVYGVHTSLDISGFDLIFRYNFSKLFEDSSVYDLNTWMIGTSFSLF
jgi:hypothetical protein